VNEEYNSEPNSQVKTFNNKHRQIVKAIRSGMIPLMKATNQPSSKTMQIPTTLPAARMPPMFNKELASKGRLR